MRDLVAKVGDLGEARTAEAYTMTTVGTRGYTAPEILQGKRYGVSADIYSFAIVMSEAVTMQKAYTDMIVDATGRDLMSWDTVVQMTLNKDLRPTLPADLDDSLRALIQNWWVVNTHMF